MRAERWDKNPELVVNVRIERWQQERLLVIDQESLIRFNRDALSSVNQPRR
jgi:hypothetical protein